MLYPLKFKPIFKEKIWGGCKISHQLHPQYPHCHDCGETWEISALKDNESVVINGFLAGNSIAELVEIYMGDLVGEKVFEVYGNDFPLLFKFIDAADDLSVQVHPNNEYAQKKGFPFGKSEMWIVLDAEEGAKINLGFMPETNQKTLENCLKNNSLESVLNFVPVLKGDVFFIPAQTVHAIGKGILLMEIQQSCDLTYRLYDYNRKDAEGKLRALHVEDGLKVIDYQQHFQVASLEHTQLNRTCSIIKTPYFVVNSIKFNQKVERIYVDVDSFVVLTCLEGECGLFADDFSDTVSKGESVLIPACIEQIVLTANSECLLIETFMP